MSSLPTGTVTFLFTDIEGSTRLLDELGEADYETALADHRAKLRAAFARRGGVEVDTQGDAFFYAFADAREAAAAAAEAQAALAEGPIKVRMGLHTGEPRLTAEGYVGREVHRAARIAAAGHGGQMLLSKQTRELVDSEVLDLGEHRVKDFSSPVWIYQLGTDRFPPLKTISNTNLPRPVSSFVGREKEVADIGALLRDGARLVTLTGPGGTGKTRLSIEAAAELVADFRNGTFWVDLAPLRDPTLVVDSIAKTVGAQGGLADHIGERQMLLVLDNLEQVVEAAPDLSALLTACPNLRVLDTSRELLRVGGEVEYAVPPLARTEALELFTARSGLPASETVATLCRRLDNLPLAVELAAARASVLSPAQILERLGNRLDLLKGGRDADPRQQTLRATIAWSYDLLRHDEQQLVANLAVFRGGWTLESAEVVAGANLDVLQSLVDKSLVQHINERFAMLQTIREFAAERLEDSGAIDELQRRHAEHFLGLAEKAEPNLRVYSAESIERVAGDHENLRAALDYFGTVKETQNSLRLAGALSDFWIYGGHVEEGWRRLHAALSADTRQTSARARALAGAADLAQTRGDIANSKLLATESLDFQRKAGETWWTAYGLGQLGLAAIDEGDYDQAKQQISEAIELWRRLGEESWAIAATRTLAWAHESSGNRETARVLHEENLVRARAAGEIETVGNTLGSLAMIAADEGRAADAIALAREALTLAIELGSAHSLAQSLCRTAEICVRFLNQPEAAAQLLGCFEGLREQIGVSEAWVARTNEETLTRITSVLDTERIDDARKRGLAMSIEEGASFALRQLSDQS